MIKTVTEKAFENVDNFRDWVSLNLQGNPSALYVFLNFKIKGRIYRLERYTINDSNSFTFTLTSLSHFLPCIDDPYLTTDRWFGEFDTLIKEFFSYYH